MKNIKAGHCKGRSSSRMSWSSKWAFLPSVTVRGEKWAFGFFNDYCFWLIDEEFWKRLRRRKKEHEPDLDLFRLHSQSILYPQRHSWALLDSAHHCLAPTLMGPWHPAHPASLCPSLLKLLSAFVYFFTFPTSDWAQIGVLQDQFLARATLLKRKLC